MKAIELKDIKPQTFYIVLEWMNTGDILQFFNPSSIFELYRISNIFLIKDLCQSIILFVTENLSENNFGMVYEFAIKIGHDGLRKAVVKKWKKLSCSFIKMNQIKYLLSKNPSDDFFVELALQLQGNESADQVQDKAMVLEYLAKKNDIYSV